jgi:hypothetical protein
LESDDFNLFADDLESLRSGNLSEREFRAKYEGHAAPAVVRAIWPNLEHYLSDRDIRARDSRYRAMQDAELAKLIRLVRIGAPDSELTTITFLRVS